MLEKYKKYQTVSILYINSPGGNLLEAIHLANLVNGLHVDVEAPEGGYCISACFFILLEGYHRSFDGVPDDWNDLSPEYLKLLPPPLDEYSFGFVGIHRPYLKSSSGDFASTKNQEELMRQVRFYLASKAVPQHLIDEMMSRPSNDIYWLKESDLELIGEFNPGDEEALIAKCGYKRTEKIVNEDWSDAKLEQLANCEADYWHEQYFPLQHEFIAELSLGWRPWQGKL